jgi:hypothetical protein
MAKPLIKGEKSRMLNISWSIPEQTSPSYRSHNTQWQASLTNSAAVPLSQHQHLLDPVREARVDKHPGEAGLVDHLAMMTLGLRVIRETGVIRVGPFVRTRLLPIISRRPRAGSEPISYIAIATHDLDNPRVAPLVDRLCPQIWSRLRSTCHEEDTRSSALVLIP